LGLLRKTALCAVFLFTFIIKVFFIEKPLPYLPDCGKVVNTVALMATFFIKNKYKNWQEKLEQE
jgi:hypothetical protein